MKMDHDTRLSNKPEQIWINGGTRLVSDCTKDESYIACWIVLRPCTRSHWTALCNKTLEQKS